MAASTSGTTCPTTGRYTTMRDSTDRSLEGAEPYDEDKVNVERFNRGGMSQGLVHLPWWEDQAIPLLLDRWGAWADTRGLLGPEDYIGSW
ncbi:hypothetical protein ABIB16_001702 [Micrococcus sp. UYEF5]